jgi:hypothetical protein
MPLPTFQVQPAMLAVDLSLLPGESRSCASTFYFTHRQPKPFRVDDDYVRQIYDISAGQSAPDV